MLSNFQPHTLFYQKRNSIHTPLILKDKMSHNFWTEFGNSSHSLVGKISRAQHTFAEITPLNSSHGQPQGRVGPRFVLKFFNPTTTSTTLLNVSGKMNDCLHSETSGPWTKWSILKWIGLCRFGFETQNPLKSGVRKSRNTR